MKINKNFLKEVPVEKQGIVMKRLNAFANLLPNKKTLSDIPKGFWVRNVAGTDIYKFRVNSGDRILYKYEQIDGEETVVLLSFQTHDKQIRAAKSMSVLPDLEEFSINHQSYVDEPIELMIDAYVTAEIYSQLEIIKQDTVYEDEYITLVIEDDEQKVNILSLEQFECLKEVLQPTIVFGCAGSGKTSIAVRKLLMNQSLYENTVYLSKSPMIIEKTKDIFPEEALDKVQFFTLKELLLKELALPQATVIEFEDFEKWMQYEQMLSDDADFSIRDVWLELNSVIKGRITQDGPIISKAEYLSSKDSLFTEQVRKSIYQMVNKYELWLKINGYYDYNDLTRMALEKGKVRTYSNIVFDEVQELTNQQLLYLLMITENKQNLLMLGDFHQVTEHFSFNSNLLKQHLYKENFRLKEYYIYKNYRSGDETVHLINGLKDITFELFSHEGVAFRLHDIPVRTGHKPALFHDENDTYKRFSQLERDVDNIVVVSDSIQKKQLLDFGLTRVFTIEETRGLEYKNVYGYNLLSSFKPKWSQLLLAEQKAHDLYQAYFNLIYLAFTRSKENLYLIESEKTLLEEKLTLYFDQSLNLQGLIGDIVETSVQDWLKEAEKLFRLRKYEKAADAYEKAGQYEKRDHCLKLASHKILYDYSDQFKCYIQLSDQKCSQQSLQVMLDCIEKKYGTTIKGVVRLHVGFTPEFGTGNKRIKGFLEPDWTNHEKAAYLYELMSQSIFDRTEITFITTLFIDENPVSLNTLTDLEHQDIHVTIRNKKLLIYSTTLSNQRELDEFYDFGEEEHRKKFQGIKGDYGFSFIEENKIKYKDSTAESILNSIFKK